MCNNRVLSSQIMFIINNTKMTAGISVRNRPRRSSARCMKYISPRAALHNAMISRITTSYAVEEIRKAKKTSARKMPISTK